MKNDILATFLALCLVMGLLPIGAMAAPEDISNGPVNISGTDCSCSETNPHVITGSGSSKITVQSGKHVVELQNVTLNAGDNNSAMDVRDGAEVTLLLSGTNTLNGDESFSGEPGIWVPAGAKLTIKGEGALEVTGGKCTGGYSYGAAAIGGGYNQDFGTIVIESGTVTARAAAGGGAGIGGGYRVGSASTQSGNVTITGGWVRAYGGHAEGLVFESNGAGIGAGENSHYEGTITISGGVVYAESGKADMYSIGAGGSIDAESKRQGNFGTNKPDGSPGNAVIVAPHAIGATENFPKWDGIFCSYYSGEDTATMLGDGTVVLNDADANIQVWGDPVVDYDLKVESGTTLRVVANDRNGASAKLIMTKEAMLTNDGTIEVATSGDDGDASKLTLWGGKEKTTGGGQLDVGGNGAVQVPLTDNLVTVIDADKQSYNGKQHVPEVEVVLNLWGYHKGYELDTDYTRNDENNTNAGTASIVLTATKDGDLLDSTVTKRYQIEKADFNLGIANNSSRTIQKGADGQTKKLPTPNISVDSNIVDDLGELKKGTLTWYHNSDWTEPVTDESLKKLTGDTTIYGRYTHGDPNFVSTKDVTINLKVSEYPVPDVTVSGPEVEGGTLTKTYGEDPVTLQVSIQVKDLEIPMANTSLTWTSTDSDVAEVDRTGTVTFKNVGTATITAYVPEHDGGTGLSYAEAEGYVEVTVMPRSIAIKSVDAVDRYYNGNTEVVVENVTPEPDPVLETDLANGYVTLSAQGTMVDAAPGNNKNVTVYYFLDGPLHENYALPQEGTTTVNIWELTGVTPEDGALTITNNLKKTYLFHLDSLKPDVGNGLPLGNVIYKDAAVAGTSGSPYDGAIRTQIVGKTLIVTVNAVDTEDVGAIGAVTVTLDSQNYKDMTATITLSAENLDQGHSYGDITVKNVLDGNGADSSDVFSYTIKLENEPLSGSTAAFDEPVAYRGTGDVEGGNGTTVTPDANGIIRFTLAGGEEITFSGNLNQDHKINYTITQLDSNGYTTTVTKAGDFTNGALLPVSNPATGYLHCSHTGTGSGTVINEWAEIVFTNAKGTAQGGNLTYHANNGTGDTELYYTTDPVAKVSDNLWFTKVDYTFDSWNTAADGSGIKYMPNSTITMNGNVDLYAQWVKNGGGDGGDGDGGYDGGDATQNEFELHYVTNGGKHLSVESEIRVWTKDYRDLPVPVREGYTFEGWYWDLRLTDRVTGDVKVDVPVVVLYAKWAEEETAAESTGVSRWLDTVNHTAYLSGYPDGTFGTDKNMTRAEVAQMFYALLLDKDVEITTSFSDVPADAWYAKAVNTLSSLGMLGGYPDGTYRPDAPITRAEFAAVALAFANEPAAAGCSYTDVSVNSWYYTYVAQASTYGWIGGYPDNTFRPDNKITRAEVCVIVNNMLGRAADQRYIDRNADELTSFADLTSNHWAYYTIMEATNSHKYSVDDGVESWSRVN